MAQIDITDLLTDPDFVDEMVMITRSAIVDTLGQNLIVETTQNSVGSVQPADYKTLKRLPDGLQNEDIYSFWFKGEIVTTNNCKYPSIINFRNRRYQVQQVADWTMWGAGWCEGICIAEKPV